MAIDLANLVRGNADIIGMVADQIGADQKKAASLQAANSAQEIAGQADAQARAANFARVGDVENILLQQVQAYNQASFEAQAAKARASQAVANLDAKMSVGLFQSPLDWLANQLTFEDDKAKTELSVAVASAKADEANAIKDQIGALNAMTQSTARTFNDIAITKTAETAEREADRIRTAGNVLANQTFLDSIKASTDMQVRARQLEMAEEDQAMQRKQFEMAKARFEFDLKEAEEKQQAFQSVIEAAKIGEAYLNRPVGVMPRNKQELDMVLKTNPNFAAAIQVGYNKIAGKTNPLGEDVAESAALLKATDAQGTVGNKKQVEFLKRQIDVAMSNPALGGMSKEQQKTVVNKGIVTEYKAMEVNADRNPDSNPTRLPAPAVILSKAELKGDPETVERLRKLQESPFIRDMVAAGKATSDKPQEVLAFAEAWAAQNKVSVSDVAAQYSELYTLVRQWHNEAARSVGLPPVAPKYEAAHASFFNKMYDPTKAESVQQQITAKAREAKIQAARSANTFGGSSYGAD